MDFSGRGGPGSESVELLTKGTVLTDPSVLIVESYIGPKTAPWEASLLVDPYWVQQPPTLGGNWRWRYRDGALTPPVARRLLALTRMYDR